MFYDCDYPRISNFFHYFSYRFEELSLKKLITTYYKNQDTDLFRGPLRKRKIQHVKL